SSMQASFTAINDTPQPTGTMVMGDLAPPPPAYRDREGTALLDPLTRFRLHPPFTFWGQLLPLGNRLACANRSCPVGEEGAEDARRFPRSGATAPFAPGAPTPARCRHSR